jgi:hypothetical protein
MEHSVLGRFVQGRGRQAHQVRRFLVDLSDGAPSLHHGGADSGTYSAVLFVLAQG